MHWRKMKPIYNPLSKDFSTTYDIHNNSKPVAFTIPAKGIGYFEPAVFEHMKKHLIDEIVNVRGIKQNWELDTMNIAQEITDLEHA